MKPTPSATPWEDADVPAVCWVRTTEAGISNWCFQCIGPTAVTVSSGTNLVTLTYPELAKSYQWSSDRKTWKPCTKEGLKEAQ